MHCAGCHTPIIVGSSALWLPQVDFPERPGALRKFLGPLSPRWNVTLFHYRRTGEQRAQVGLLSPSRKAGWPGQLQGRSSAASHSRSLTTVPLHLALMPKALCWLPSPPPAGNQASGVLLGVQVPPHEEAEFQAAGVRWACFGWVW